MKIGCDPEFLFMDTNGDHVAANKILKDGDLGMDGHSSTAELRPKEASSSLQLIANLRKLILKGLEYDDIAELAMLSGHYKFETSIGGHIHISGFPMDMALLAAKLKKTLGRLSDCIDNLAERDRRTANGYGFGERAEYRQQGNHWIEFRRAGSWLLSPQVSFMNIWLAEATAYAYKANDTAAFKCIDDFEGCDSIIRFANHMVRVPHRKIYMKVADKVFSSLPLDWNEDFKRYWS